tara:strand:+ start:203 stop:364 length:162 start_codon:yes stop_codon:yes gene_type:complete
MWFVQSTGFRKPKKLPRCAHFLRPFNEVMKSQLAAGFCRKFKSFMGLSEITIK